MNKKKIIKKTADYVKKELQGEGSGHDWWHIYRVWQNAKHIGEKEKADMFVVEIGALLHDIADYKFHDGDETIGPKVATSWLEKNNVDEIYIKKVREIIKDVSFKGANVKKKIRSIEGKIVQDADRLDAIGALGIARCFAYGGYKDREIYNPEIKPVMHTSADEYKKNNSPSINHFYEKLFLLKDLMNTREGKRMAINRHKFMKQYLNQFYKEWEGKL